MIGFVPPQIVQWDKSHLDGKATTIDIVDAANKHVPDLKKAGADIVVALCHSGIAGGERKGGEENAALHLAKVDGIDVILTGHQHLTFPGGKEFNNIPGVDVKAGTLHGKPAVMAGFWGSHLGLIDLELTKEGNAWKVANFRTEARPIYDRVDRKIVPKVDSDAAVIAAAQADHDATLKYVREPVGTTAVPIHSYYSLVADDASVKLVAEAQAWYVADQLKTTPPTRTCRFSRRRRPSRPADAAVPNYFTEIKPGPLAIKDMADIYIYPNTIRAVKITGAQVREWLERSAGIYNQIDVAKGGEQELINPKFPAYNFDVIAGVQYKIDPTQASRYDDDGKVVNADAHRIKDLTYNGKPVTDDQAVHRRDQQLPRWRRRQLPRRGWHHDRVRGAGSHPRRDHALHHRAQGSGAEGRRLLVARGSRRRHHDLPHRPERRRLPAGRASRSRRWATRRKAS